MTLSDRIHAHKCAVRDCARTRAQDTDVCSDDLNAKWRNLLDRQDDGTYLRRRTFIARDETRLAA